MDATHAARPLWSKSGPGVIVRPTVVGGRPAVLPRCRTGQTHFGGPRVPVPTKSPSIFSMPRGNLSSSDITQQHIVTVRVIGPTGARFCDGKPSVYRPFLVMPWWNIQLPDWIYPCVHSCSRMYISHIICYVYNHAACLALKYFVYIMYHLPLRTAVASATAGVAFEFHRDWLTTSAVVQRPA